MPIEGTLREFALPDIFQLLNMSRKSGELGIVQSPSGVRGAVLFSDGAVIDARLADTPSRLAYMLLNAGKISEAELRKAERTHAKNPAQSWKEIFRGLGSVATEDLDEYARFEVEEHIYEILDWRDGHFVFSERSIANSERVTFIPVESLLMEGARRADELSALGASLEGSAAIPRLAEQAATDTGVIDLSPEEWEILGRVDGVANVRTLSWTLGRSEFEVSKAISSLVAKGILEFGSRREAIAPERQEDVLGQAAELIERDEMQAARVRIDSAPKRGQDEPRAQYLAALVLEREGDLRGAERGYEGILRLDPLAHEARKRLGLVRLKLGDIAGAARSWEFCLQAASDAAERERFERGLRALRELQALIHEIDDRENS
ncbi:MAG: DUF4388 domain-containing protein [Gemmatimonadota bacterium]|nr:MAG: DUF4388 domain-containing protein [Gemmatimonadota bacterium]